MKYVLILWLVGMGDHVSHRGAMLAHDFATLKGCQQALADVAAQTKRNIQGICVANPQ